MDPTKPATGQTVQGNNSVSVASELEHVTQEMYKKNAELFFTNKTLSILQKINSIILSSVTDLRQVSSQVAEVLISDAEFKRVSIFVVRDHEGLAKLSSSGGEAVKRAEFLIKRSFPSEFIPIEHKNNILIRALESRQLQIASSYQEILFPDYTSDEALLIQQTLNVHSIFAYPLIVRDEVIGVLAIRLGEDAGGVSAQEQDLMGRLVGTIGIAVDNALLYKKIQDANIQLKELDKLKDEFVSLASHELRTPMTIIKSYVWMLLEKKAGEINDKQKEYLEKTYHSTNRLIDLVNDMLNISRIESGRMTVEAKEVDIIQLISETMNEVKARAQELGINLTLKNETDQIIAVCDPGKIKQVLVNLIGNSLKFTPQGGSISLKVLDNSPVGMVSIAVSDTGKGINAEDIKKLFKKFNMVGSSHLIKNKDQGTGLGLYLSKAIVELHGGEIKAVSEVEGKGSEFSFTLPKKVATTVSVESAVSGIR